MKRHRGFEYTVRPKGPELEWEVYPKRATEPGLLIRGTISHGWDLAGGWTELAAKFAEAAIDLHVARNPDLERQ